MAEAAFLVEDAYHHTGVGTLLLEHLAADARDHGIGHFTAVVLPAIVTEAVPAAPRPELTRLEAGRATVEASGSDTR